MRGRGTEDADKEGGIDGSCGDDRRRGDVLEKNEEGGGEADPKGAPHTCSRGRGLAMCSVAIHLTPTPTSVTLVGLLSVHFLGLLIFFCSSYSSAYILSILF